MGIFARLFGPPDQERFARMVAEAIRRAGETSPLRHDAARFRLLSADDPPSIMHLGNCYREYCAAPRAGRREVLRRYLRCWFDHLRETPDDFEDARHDLLPVVRGRSYFENLRLQARVDGVPEPDLRYRTLAEHYGVGVVYDLPHSMMQVMGHHLEAWGVGYDEALRVARENLAARSGAGLERLAPGLWVSPWSDNYDAARLLLLDLIGRHEVVGDPVALVPNRDALVLTGSLDDAGLVLLAEVAERVGDHPRPLPAIPLCLRGETWVPFLPEPDCPSYPKLKMLWLKSLAQVYGEQEVLLDALHRKAGEDRFVAGYTVIRDEASGAYRSYCTWTEGADTLLPETDLIVLVGQVEGGEGVDLVASGDWERVREVVGDLLEPQGLSPERYRARAFPDAGQLAAIGRTT